MLIQAAVFVLALLFAPKRGLVAGWRRRGERQPDAESAARAEVF